jgi:hypothetical protein
MSDDQTEHYTEHEARALIGKTFESIVEFPRVPKGARGRVVEVDNTGLGHWDVVIEWGLPRRAPNAGVLNVESERVPVIQPNEPLCDRFTRAEMQRFMNEVSE